VRKSKTPPAAVDTRGQISVEFEGQKFILRPSWEAINAIEQQTGRGLYELATLATTGQLALDVLSLIVVELMRAYGRANPQDPLHATYMSATTTRISELIYESSIPQVLARVAVVLLGALTGGYTASGEAKPATR
jgi:hypothetical protein